MPYPSVSYTLTNGTANDAGPVNSNFTDIINALSDGTKNLNIAALSCTSVTSSGAISGTTITAATDVVIGTVSVLGSLVPIGTIIPFYDFSAALTFDTDNWVYCDGSTATVGGSSRTLPDLSGRYLVGFGTPNGGGDIDTATWATAAVGNTSHTSASIAHTHTGPSHTHTGPSHTHSEGTLKFGVAFTDSAGALSMYDTSGVATKVADDRQSNATAGASLIFLQPFTASTSFFTTNGSGATGSGGTGATGASGTGNTGSALTTISVQPESIRVRFLMRKA